MDELDGNTKKTTEEQFYEDRSKWTNIVKTMSSNLRDLTSLAETQVDLYSNRQIGVEQMHQLLGTYSKLNKLFKQKKSDELTKLVNGNNYNVRLQNKENEAILDSKLSEVQYKLDLVKAQIEFFKETVKSIDAIIYGVKYRMELANYMRNV